MMLAEICVTNVQINMKWNAACRSARLKRDAIRAMAIRSRFCSPTCGTVEPQYVAALSVSFGQWNRIRKASAQRE
jgi:hypothetical protein